MEFLTYNGFDGKTMSHCTDCYLLTLISREAKEVSEISLNYFRPRPHVSG